MRNYLIVESENDQYFIEALLESLNASQNTLVRYAIHGYGYSPIDSKGEKLANALEQALAITDISRIGVVLDMDNADTASRLAFVRDALQKAITNAGLMNSNTPKLQQTNTLYPFILDEVRPLEIACYFTHINSQGELEDVLKAIKLKDSTFADCLEEGWQKCFEAKGKKVAESGEQGDISKKELVKFWVDVYKRFDTLKKGDRNEKTTAWQAVWQRTAPIFNLNDSALDELKDFLRLFTASAVIQT